MKHIRFLSICFVVFLLLLGEMYSQNSNVPKPDITINADSYVIKKDNQNDSIKTIIDKLNHKSGVKRHAQPSTLFTIENYESAPYVEYKVSLPKGSFQISIQYFILEQISYSDVNVVAMVVGDENVTFGKIPSKRANIQTINSLVYNLSVSQDVDTKIRIYMLDKNLVLNQINVTCEWLW